MWHINKEICPNWSLCVNFSFDVMVQAVTVVLIRQSDLDYLSPVCEGAEAS
jgi:hypothetical protein